MEWFFKVPAYLPTFRGRRGSRREIGGGGGKREKNAPNGTRLEEIDLLNLPPLPAPPSHSAPFSRSCTSTVYNLFHSQDLYVRVPPLSVLRISSTISVLSAHFCGLIFFPILLPPNLLSSFTASATAFFSLLLSLSLFPDPVSFWPSLSFVRPEAMRAQNSNNIHLLLPLSYINAADSILRKIYSEKGRVNEGLNSPTSKNNM